MNDDHRVTQDYIDHMTEEWGPLGRGDFPLKSKVRYSWVGGQVKQGEIIWCIAAGQQPVQGRGPLPLQYLIVRQGAIEGFPDVVNQGAILGLVEEEEEADTATLVFCPFCLRTHVAEGVEWCKNKRR